LYFRRDVDEGHSGRRLEPQFLAIAFHGLSLLLASGDYTKRINRI
jgi:hypothetical protein